MDNTNQPQNNPPQQPPVIPESELKLPEEGVNGAAPAPNPKHAFSPLLVVLLVLLLAVLAAVIIWGEELVGLVLPQETVELPALPSEQTEQNELSEMDQLEAEINQNETELNALEQELNQMEASIEAGMSTSTIEASSSGTRCDPGQRC